MSSPAENPLTRILSSAADGDTEAREQLIARTYDELKAIARNHLRSAPRHGTLHPTALVHEAFVQLFADTPVRSRDRREFFGLAAKVMRDLLVDHGRQKAAAKRGGDLQRVTLSAAPGGGEQDVDALDLCDALDVLSERDERQHAIVELRAFAGLAMEEIAEVLSLSLSTVEREWRAARAWLAVRLSESSG